MGQVNPWKFDKDHLRGRGGREEAHLARSNLHKEDDPVSLVATQTSFSSSQWPCGALAAEGVCVNREEGGHGKGLERPLPSAPGGPPDNSAITQLEGNSVWTATPSTYPLVSKDLILLFSKSNYIMCHNVRRVSRSPPKASSVNSFLP